MEKKRRIFLEKVRREVKKKSESCEQKRRVKRVGLSQNDGLGKMKRSDVSGGIISQSG